MEKNIDILIIGVGISGIGVAAHLSKQCPDRQFEIIERRYDSGSTIYCTQFRKSDWHQRLGGGVHADAIMDRIVHNAVWYDTGQLNMCEHHSFNQQ